jgi:hypothetical protein
MEGSQEPVDRMDISSAHKETIVLDHLFGRSVWAPMVAQIAMETTAYKLCLLTLAQRVEI